MTHLLCMSEPYFTGSVLKLASVFNWLTFCILSLSASFHHIYFILSSAFHSCAFSLPFFCIFLLIEETPLLAFKPTSALQIIFFPPPHSANTFPFHLFSPLSFCPFVHHSFFHLCCVALLSLQPPSAFVPICSSSSFFLLCVCPASVNGQDTGPVTAPRPAQPWSNTTATFQSLLPKIKIQYRCLTVAYWAHTCLYMCVCVCRGCFFLVYCC